MNCDPTPANSGDDVELLVLEREKEGERVRARERAEKKFAFVTKEVDYRIAKAYVAIAKEFGDEDLDFPDKNEKNVKVFGTGTSDEDEDEDGGGRKKGSNGHTGLEACAIGRYLDDEEWEKEELKAGRAPRPTSFAFGIHSSH